jgi:hypothetical protein
VDMDGARGHTIFDNSGVVGLTTYWILLMVTWRQSRSALRDETSVDRVIPNHLG